MINKVNYKKPLKNKICNFERPASGRQGQEFRIDFLVAPLLRNGI